MLSATSAIHRAPAPAATLVNTDLDDRHVLSEAELARLWNIHPKTLQRWRSEGRGPKYMKLSKRVVYPVTAIKAFEQQAMHLSTSERGADLAQQGATA